MRLVFDGLDLSSLLRNPLLRHAIITTPKMLHSILQVLSSAARIFFPQGCKELVAHNLDFDGAPIDRADEGAELFEETEESPTVLVTSVKMEFDGQVLVLS
jgi:hypothetical protein